jgi:precorrin-6A/cobalt-precorrin-6A reductase
MDSQRGDAALSVGDGPGNGILEDMLLGDMARVLILGGTTEARLLGERLARRGGLDVSLSLAGRTLSPVPHAVPVRIGGFGGAGGLADYIVKERVDVLIDATHPYATMISENAIAAAQQTRVPFVALRRAPWIAGAGDRWIEVIDTLAAVQALGEAPRRVFVALGRNELVPFVGAPQHFYLIRSVDPVDPPLPLPHASYVTERGPFSEAHDLALMTAHKIDIVIAKNSGGSAAYGKIAAARTLGIEVIILRRPQVSDGPAVHTLDDAIAWLDHALTPAVARGV